MTLKNITSGVDTAQTHYAHLLGSTKEQVEKASATAFKAYEDLSKFSKENLDAYVAATSAVAKGLEAIGRIWATLTQERFEAGAQVTQSLLTAKTLREVVDVQTAFARTTFDKVSAEGTKVSEISVQVANEAAEPISARVNATIEKLLKPIAA